MKRIAIITAALLATCIFSCRGSEHHNEQYITSRLNEIYNHVFAAYGDHDAPGYGVPQEDFDSLFCSTAYNATMNRILDLAGEDEIVVDSDHWIQGQDWELPLKFRVVKVYDIHDNTAKADVVVYNFRDHELTLELFFERGDWYVDNFISYYEDYDYDERWREIPGTFGRKEVNERRWMDEWLQKRAK